MNRCSLWFKILNNLHLTIIGTQLLIVNIIYNLRNELKIVKLVL